MSVLKVGLLLTVLTALFVGIGRLVGGPSGALIAFGLALVMNAGSYWFSDKMVLKMYGAQPLDENQASQLYRMTERLAQAASVPMPKLYIIDDPQPNAFATGRNPQNAAVAVNSGLLNILDEREVEGVVAHEIAHIKHRDTLTMTVVATISGAIMMIAQMGQFAAMFGGMNNDDEEGGNPIAMFAMMMIAPLAAGLIQMAVSRAREYEADATAARLTGTPRGLMGALAKLEQTSHAIPPAHANPQTAHLCIVNPLAGFGGVGKLFRTHPPTEERIARLSAM
jgi:heat shock protein HtpX